MTWLASADAWVDHLVGESTKKYDAVKIALMSENQSPACRGNPELAYLSSAAHFPGGPSRRLLSARADAYKAEDLTAFVGNRPMPKNYQGLMFEQVDVLKEANLRKDRFDPEIDPDNPRNAFECVVALVKENGDELDKELLAFFDRCKLNIEDPFHWWQLLTDFVRIHTDRTAGASKKWTADQIEQLEKDCVTAGLLEPATDSIAEMCRRLKSGGSYTQTPENLQAVVSRFKLADSIKGKIARSKLPNSSDANR